MSSHLYWEPVSAPKNSLPYDLLCALRKNPFKRIDDGAVFYNEGSLSYFQGLLDAGVQGAQQVIDAIIKHKEIKLFIGD